MQSCQSDFPPSFQDYSIHPHCHTQSVLEESVYARGHKYLLTLHFPAAPESYHSLKTALLPDKYPLESKLLPSQGSKEWLPESRLYRHERHHQMHQNL